jgi:hypothetical protein
MMEIRAYFGLLVACTAMAAYCLVPGAAGAIRG